MLLLHLLFIMVVTPMCAKVIRTFYEYIQQASVFRLDLIKGDNPHSFTRKRHTSVIDLINHMLNRKDGSQWSDVMDYYQDLGKKHPITETDFYLDRKRFNPQAMCIMSNKLIPNYYDNEADSFIKWKGNLVLAVDGSKIIFPDTKENASVFGRISAYTNPTKNQAKLLEDFFYLT